MRHRETEAAMAAPVTERAPGMNERPLVVHPVMPLVGVLVMMVALALLVLTARPPAAQPITAPEDAFSAARAMETMQRLIGNGAPHPVGSEANAQVGARLIGELTDLGYAVETQSTFVCRAAWGVCGEVTNILSRAPGETDGPAILLTAHYDSVGAGPGAADDMAGVAAILEVARILRDEPPPKNPIIFLLSDGEEPGLLGAEAFVADHPWAAEVGVTINLEANGSGGQSILFETTEPNAWLIDAFAAHAARPVVSSLSDQLYALLPFNTDLTVYEEAGIAGINFAFTEEFPHYHTPLDRSDQVDPGSVQHHGDNALAAIRAFAAYDLANPPAGNSVFQDIVPGTVLRWPEPWTIWMALALLVTWLGIAVVSIRRGEVSVRELLWAAPVLPLGVAGAVLLGYGLARGVSILAGTANPWYAYPAPIRVAIWSGALLWMAIVAAVAARRAGFRGLLVAGWLWWALLASIIAALVPAASMPMLVPTLLATVSVAVVIISPVRRSMRAWAAATLVALFGACWLWLWFARGSDFSALGPDLGPTVGFAVGISASAWASLLAIPVAFNRGRKWAFAGLAGAIVVATGVSLLVPVSSAYRPERLNLLHVQDNDAGQAYWVVDRVMSPEGTRDGTPASLLRAGFEDGQMMPVLPWSAREYLVAPAPVSTAPPGTIALERANPADEGRLVTLIWPSSPDGHWGSLVLPISAGLRSIEVEGAAHGVGSIPAENGYQRFLCIAPACNGREVTMHLLGNTPFTAFFVDTAPGLPKGGDRFVAARGDTAVASDEGDASLNITRLTVGGG